VSGTITIVAGDTQAKLALRGAELCSWQVAGKELMWQRDPAFWPATSPVLFPICGATNGGKIRVAGQSFSLGLHGFAAQSMFAVTNIEKDHVQFALRDDVSTRGRYPFGFDLTVEYRVAPGRIDAQLRVCNTGNGPMPYACGLHPGFCWPFGAGSQEDYQVVFEKAEAPDVPVIAPGGLFSSRLREVPLAGRALRLTPALFAAEALCFLNIASQELDFVGPEGSIRVAIENFSHFVLWTKPPAQYLCIEAWSGYGDPENFTGDLFAKPSMRVLAPGEEGVHAAYFSFVT
jgi:galactose mutarotase-like enzyme